MRKNQVSSIPETAQPGMKKSKMQNALESYFARQARTEHPRGTFDKKQRWYPDDNESQHCCCVRSPTKAYPYSLMVHCRTAKHIANLFDVDYKKMRSHIAQYQLLLKETPQ